MVIADLYGKPSYQELARNRGKFPLIETHQSSTKKGFYVTFEELDEKYPNGFVDAEITPTRQMSKFALVSV